MKRDEGCDIFACFWVATSMGSFLYALKATGGAAILLAAWLLLIWKVPFYQDHPFAGGGVFLLGLIFAEMIGDFLILTLFLSEGLVRYLVKRTFP